MFFFEYSSIDIVQLLYSSLSFDISTSCVDIASVNPLTSFFVVENKLTNHAHAVNIATIPPAIAVNQPLATATATHSAITAVVNENTPAVLHIRD
jgi:hypothetical protein